MKKILLLLLIFSSCKKEVLYYPSKSFFEEHNPQEIVVDNLNYEETVDSLINQIFKKKRHFIKIEKLNKIYKISPFTYTGGFIKEKNGLEIVDDSICISLNKYPFTQLSKYLQLHYENNGKSEFLSDSYKRAFIKLVLEPKESSEKLKSSLLNIISVYNQTNIKNKDSIVLEIMLEFPLDKDLTKIIPPPPIIIED